MVVYLKNKETHEILQTFENVIEWGYNFVEYRNQNNYRTKTYCGESEYFTDIGAKEGYDEN